MGFMEREVEFGEWVVIDGSHGITFVPRDVVGSLFFDGHEIQVGETIQADDENSDWRCMLGNVRDYYDGPSDRIDSIGIREGWGARWSAPGYMDCTEWCVYDTEREANDALDENDDELDDDDESDDDDDDEPADDDEPLGPEEGDIVSSDTRETTAMPELDEFTEQYIETALQSSTDNTTPQGGEPLDANYSVDDIAPDTLAQMAADCQSFQAKVGDLILDDVSRAGHDFWLTRNGHGAGFWDGDWDGLVEGMPRADATDKPYESVGDYLSDVAHEYGTYDLYIGDDGQIHGS